MNHRCVQRGNYQSQYLVDDALRTAQSACRPVSLGHELFPESTSRRPHMRSLDLGTTSCSPSSCYAGGRGGDSLCSGWGTGRRLCQSWPMNRSPGFRKPSRPLRICGSGVIPLVSIPNRGTVIHGNISSDYMYSTPSRSNLETPSLD